VLLLNGGDVDFLMGASAATFEAINHVPLDRVDWNAELVRGDLSGMAIETS
jgi:hypothetical protein